MNAFRPALAALLMTPAITWAAPQKTPPMVSVSQLTAQPARYQNQIVNVTGYWKLGFEESSLCENAKEERAKCLWVGSIRTARNGSKKDRRLQSALVNTRQNGTCFVTITGTYLAQASGHMGLWPGSLENITDIRHINR